MPKFIFAYHGGKAAESEEEMQQVMAAWGAWMEGIGTDLVDGGNPAGASMTVSASGVEEGGGPNPISGYSLVNVPDMAAAIEIAKSCPIVEHGSVEVAEALEM